MSDLKGIKILAFTWNTDGLSICKSNVTKKAGAKTQKVGNVIQGKNCVVPDFMEELRDKIKQENTRPHILIFSTQGEPNKNTYFKDFLNDTLSTIGYYRISYQKYENISEVQSGNKPRTEFKDGAIRQSIFIENTFRKNVVEIKSKSLGYLFNTALTPVQKTNCQDGERNSGAIATYLKLLGYGTVAFITVHLPAGVRALGVDSSNAENYAYYRENIKAANRLCMLHIIEKFIVKVKDDFNLNYAILMGDLNYTIEGPIQRGGQSYQNSLDFIQKAIPNNTKNFSDYAKNLYETDELKQEIESSNTRLKYFEEGVGNQGPRFLPNWNMLAVNASRSSEYRSKSRERECLKKQENTSLCYDPSESNPCWRDRILYANAQKTNDGQKIRCVEYDSYDSGNINFSDHAAIVAIFDIGQPEPITSQNPPVAPVVPVTGGAAAKPPVKSRAATKRLIIEDQPQAPPPQTQPQASNPPVNSEEELIKKKNQRVKIINEYFEKKKKITDAMNKNFNLIQENEKKIYVLEDKLQIANTSDSKKISKQINDLKKERVQLDGNYANLFEAQVAVEKEELDKTKNLI